VAINIGDQYLPELNQLQHLDDLQISTFHIGVAFLKKFLAKANALTHGFGMQTISATTARSMIYKLLDDTAASHEPIQITGKRSNGVLVSEDDWRSIQETLHLVSIPGLKGSGINY